MNSKNRKCLNSIIYVIVFLFFAFITYKTPLAGDDWGYAINGMKANPFEMAYNFYFSWSGRYFSELWGFIVAPNKWLWNILNPLLFTFIFILINKVANIKYKNLAYLVSFMLIIFVSDNLRMETYTWIMGTTYVVPLAAALSILYIFVKSIENNKIIVLWQNIYIGLASIYIGLCMENIAAVMIFAAIILLVYAKINRYHLTPYITLLLTSTLGLIILRLSPGSAYRLSENVHWTSMNLFQQIWTNVPNFIKFTFYDNKYLILVFTLILLVLIFQKKQKLWLKVFALSISLVVSILLVSNKLYSITHIEIFNFFNLFYSLDISLIVNIVVWLIFILYSFFVIIGITHDFNRDKSIFFLLIAGASNVVMLISPIFGSRSSIYFYFFLIIVVLTLLGNLRINNFIKWVLSGVILILIIFRGYSIITKYLLVDKVQTKRLELLQYYIENPSDKDVWLPRMPIYSVHAADIEQDDLYHMDVFKQYYGLAPDTTINFYITEVNNVDN